MKQKLLKENKIEISQDKGAIVISLTDLPYLADHAFQGMVVLPGSAYIEMSLIICNQLYNKLPFTLSKINFENLIILSENDTKIDFELFDDSDKELRIKFKEKIENDKSIEKTTSATTLYLHKDELAVTSQIYDFRISEFQKAAEKKILAEEFYSKLSQNGNQYGPQFQNIKEIWLSGTKALARLKSKSKVSEIPGDHFLNPSLLDSFTQLLSVLNESNGRTFILNSIEKIKVFNYDFPEEVWCTANLSPNIKKEENGFEGDLKVFDPEGKIYIELNGVKFKYLETFQTHDKIPDKVKNALCIASTFTADPLEDSLKYWDDYFNLSFDVQFAPYNQVFQELLNPQSLLSVNQNGINVILLGLEDWTRNDHGLTSKVSDAEREKLFKDKSTYTLPNHLEIVHLNKYETEYVYKEIFADKCYLKHGIALNDGDTIIDIGANIGLFTLFVNQYCKDPVVYSFEPSPVVYDLLKTNSELYGSRVKTFNLGVSDREKTATFTFYESSSVFSSFNPDETKDKEAIQAVVRNMLKDTAGSDDGSIEEYVEELTSGRLESKSYECRLLSISDIIKENNIKKIDLLKIDAEKSELGIIQGINDEDWDKIEQIVIEIHDKSRKVLEEIEKILKSNGFSIAVEEEKMLKESGLFNVFAIKKISDDNQQVDNNQTKSLSERLSENIENFVNALSSFKQRSTIPLVVAVTPRSTEAIIKPAFQSLFDKYEEELFDQINSLPNVYTITSESLLAAYPIVNYYDPQGDELGHIPYTLPFFSSLGTSLIRLIFSLEHSPYKVIALDCDNTLWKGVCGEDGPRGIQISENYKFLQKFIIDQINAGMLVCLCSKNNEEDVLEVFRQRDDMLLKQEHLVSWRTNWDYKSVNLRSIAEELNLGLDSFMFIDDNPVECAEVKANCPEVFTLQLPQREEVIPIFLKNIWAFDHLKVTEEDKKRTKMYQENIRREKYLSSALTLKDFLEGLNLQIKISQPDPEQMERVSQLTYRTNQFNFTTIRRSESEINKLINEEKYKCLIANVSDRFGDYGLVGLLLYKTNKDIIEVDTFLLSCRVLGRGVEHKILSELGSVAIEKGLNIVEITYLESNKNKPALDFIESFGKEFKSEISDGFKYTFPAEYLKNLDYKPASLEVKEVVDKSGKKKKSTNQVSGNYNEKIQQIGAELKDINEVFRRIEAYKIAQSDKEKINYVAPETDFEIQMAEIWQKVLGVSKIGLDDNFFEAGGTSLKAVQLIATIKKELKKNISVVTLFECPTVKLLSKKIGNADDKEDSEGQFESQVDRGVRRRNKIISRRR
ncbi:MAG: FkbM family methyltransferase [Ignavibacteriaceae bacterium]|nr:FkbM family methyltransferase [Ignavibacteriaceae bacterium]